MVSVQRHYTWCYACTHTGQVYRRAIGPHAVRIALLKILYEPCICIVPVSLLNSVVFQEWPSDYMEGQTSIKSLAERNLREIASALDEFEKSTSEEYWRLLVDQLPRGSFQRWEVERFAAAALQDHSPSLLLLEVVQQRQLVSTIEDLVIALERIGCHRAVNALTLKCEAMCMHSTPDNNNLKGRKY